MFKRSVILFLLVSVLMCGCQSKPVLKGDFRFDLPEGFAVSDVTDESCSITDDSGAAVGGILLTDLKAKDLQSSDSGVLSQYFNRVAWGCEYISMQGGDNGHPIQLVNMNVTNPDTQKTAAYQRILFVKDSAVYDMWFDLSLIDEETVAAFGSVAEGA